MVHMLKKPSAKEIQSPFVRGLGPKAGPKSSYNYMYTLRILVVIISIAIYLCSFKNILYTYKYYLIYFQICLT